MHMLYCMHESKSIVHYYRTIRTGKTTLIKRAIKEIDHLGVSISYTTRSPRASEHDGQSYYFIDDATFQDKIKQGEFVEHAKVYEHYYGTAWQDLVSLRSQEKDVILEIDYQGAINIQKIIPEAISIFILPPSYQALKDRLSSRAEDSQDTINLRLERASDEMKKHQNLITLYSMKTWIKRFIPYDPLLKHNGLSGDHCGLNN